MYNSILSSVLTSKLAYYNKNNAIIRLSPNKTKIIENIYTNSHIYINQCENNNIIAFRGTHDIYDLINLAKISKKKYSFREDAFEMHSGIYNMFESIENELTEYIVNDIKGSITFCGYSLGGCLASFASAYYASLFNNNIKITCHTFGSPRIGNKEYVKWHEKRVHNSLHFVNDHDILTFFPQCKGYYNFKKIILPNDKINPFVAHDLNTYIEEIKKL